MTKDPPAGFRPLESGGRFIADNGPIFWRRDGDGLVFGFVVQERNCNPGGIAHGGWLASVADMILPLSATQAAELQDYFLLTVSFSLDYLAPAPLGSWVQGRGTLIGRTRQLVFAQGTLTIEDAVILRFSGVFKLKSPAKAA